MSFSDLKFYALSVCTFSVTYTQLDKGLKLLLLVVSIGYGIDKWLDFRRNKKKKNGDLE